MSKPLMNGKPSVQDPSSTICADCGKDLTSRESIDRHRGTACHIAYLERRIQSLEDQQVLMMALIEALKKEV